MTEGMGRSPSTSPVLRDASPEVRGAGLLALARLRGRRVTPKVPVEPVLARRTDVAVGSRYLPGAGGNVSSPLRQVGTWFFSRLLRLLVGVRIHDATSGFRAFGREATEFLSRYYPDDYPEVQAYVPLARRGFRMLEVPVDMRRRRGGSSSITPIRSIYYMVKVAFATAIEVIRPLPPRGPRK